MARVSRALIGQAQVRRPLLELGGQAHTAEKRWGKEKPESWVPKEKKTAGRPDTAIGEKSHALAPHAHSLQQPAQGSHPSCPPFKCFWFGAFFISSLCIVGGFPYCILCREVW